ncbi:fatty acid desaturase-domain-containing protein [Cerioporus squamosus]|nr:fatty acid desaturase-domain-containing protein [Cerioporus squamosus]
MPSKSVETSGIDKARIWWSNGAFFVGVHIAAVAGMWNLPPARAARQTLLLAVFLWQAASMGITVGYHRLYSHRAFRAALPVRIFVALLGASAFQGSIKWWCLRHRLHHRFTDDPRHDPYAATKGFFWSHMGWIFFKSQYDRLKTIESKDLDNDIVVRLQHKYYVPLALLTGFVLPPAIGLVWRDPLGAFIYAGLVSRLLIWHCTFLVNSLAHWDGLQPYSDDNTSKSNLFLALLTCGEGNHNFHHSFPHDFRSGPSLLDWDPSKWAIVFLQFLGLASGLRRARVEDISAAREHMLQKEIIVAYASDSTTDLEEQDEQWSGETWTKERLATFAGAEGRCVLLLRGYVVDVTEYMTEHPGGASLLRRYAVGRPRSTGNNGDGEDEGEESRQRTADWAFHGGINKHSQAAKRLMRKLRIAKVQ